MSRRSLNGLNLNSQRIQKLGAPTASDDAATKAYADSVTTLKQFATSGDLSASPAALVTFLGLDAYTFLHFDFAAVGHDYTAANQNFSLQLSMDGSTWGNATAFSPTISSGGRNHGHLEIIANGTNKPRIQVGMTTGNPLASGTVSNSVEAPRLVWGGGKIVGVRFFASTSGNLNTGVISASGN